MKKAFLTLFSIFTILFLSAQGQVTITGVVTEAGNEDPIPRAKIVCDSTIVIFSDDEGNYKLTVSASATHKLVVSFYSFEKQTINLKVGKNDLVQNFSMKLENELEEVVVVSTEIAKTRETPVAFSKISARQIAEELGTRDLPMILNSTPGAYATEQGGGAGDARVSIRGFDQRNVAVLVDGVPVNDMENGQVYWSNWDGLSDITRFMQVQRGLGASKLSIVSVGGTMNIITKGIDQKMGASVKQEINSYGLYKTAFGFNSGMLKGNWGVTLAGARKWGNSYADATYTDAWSYFFKIQKKYKSHLFSLGINGAPQSHGQRTTKLPIAVVDERLAKKAGVNYLNALDSIGTTSSLYFATRTSGARGNRYNPNYGYMNGEIVNEKVNYFHKPQVNLNHSWNPNSRFSLTNVLYMSVGKGGGTSMRVTPARDTLTGLYDFQGIYDNNSTTYSNLYSTTEHASSNYLRAANNDHKWFGLLSSATYKINENISTLFGIDARYYKGSHYQTVYDLMGGDYAIDNSDKNQPKGQGNTAYAMKRKGDKISFNNDAYVKWGGLFGQIEYKKKAWSTFLTGSVSQTGYQRVDHFKNKDLVFDDTTLVQAVGYGDTVIYDGKEYTNNSSEARTATTEQKWFLGATVKGGANYNIDANHNVFMNIGYLNIAPRMNTVFDNANRMFLDIKNQKVYSAEAGYGYKSKRFTSNVNLYYTLWRNKPPQYTPTITTPDGTYSYNINGLDALHKGIELDFIYKINKKIDFEGLASIGDWKTISGNTVFVTDIDGNYVDTVDFSAKNVHVGDAAQVQIGGSLRYEPIKRLYFKLRYTYFAKNFANFDPINLLGENKDRESWQMPNYGLLDLNFGYSFDVFKKYTFTINGGVMNITNEIYITDAQNGVDFNGSTANVFVGMGTRFNLGLKIGF